MDFERNLAFLALKQGVDRIMTQETRAIILSAFELPPATANMWTILSEKGFFNENNVYRMRDILRKLEMDPALIQKFEVYIKKYNLENGQGSEQNVATVQTQSKPANLTGFDYFASIATSTTGKDPRYLRLILHNNEIQIRKYPLTKNIEARLGPEAKNMTLVELMDSGKYPFIAKSIYASMLMAKIDNLEFASTNLNSLVQAALDDMYQGCTVNYLIGQDLSTIIGIITEIKKSLLTKIPSNFASSATLLQFPQKILEWADQDATNRLIVVKLIQQSNQLLYINSITTNPYFTTVQEVESIYQDLLIKSTQKLLAPIEKQSWAHEVVHRGKFSCLDLTDEEKKALVNCFEKEGYINENRLKRLDRNILKQYGISYAVQTDILEAAGVKN